MCCVLWPAGARKPGAHKVERKGESFRSKLPFRTREIERKVLELIKKGSVREVRLVPEVAGAERGAAPRSEREGCMRGDRVPPARGHVISLSLRALQQPAACPNAYAHALRMATSH